MDALQNHGVSPEQTDTLPAWVDDFNDRVTSPTLPECFAPMKGDLADYSSLLFEYKQLLDVLLNVGLVNRMFHVELAASPRLWLEWAAQNNIHPYIYDYIPSRPDHLWSKPPQSEEPFSTPRAWHMLSDAIHSFGPDIDMDNLRILAAGQKQGGTCSPI